jgi:CHAT domain-containing protein
LIVLFLGALALLTSACTGAAANDGERAGPLVEGIRHAGPLPRLWVQRFSVATTLAPCRVPPVVSSLRCASAPERAMPASLGPLIQKIRAGLQDSAAADALHAAALLDVLSGDSTGNSVERSISYLEMSTRQLPSASSFGDLAAARLIYAGSRGGAKALVGALDAAGRALAMNATYTPALFDYALALDLLALDAQAEDAWGAFLAVEPRSSDADEARRRLAELATELHGANPTGKESASALRQFAHVSPAEALVLAWETLLPAWGTAIVRGDSTAAAGALERARGVGEQLARDRDDSSVARAVQAAVSATGQRRRLGELHALYGRAQAQATKNAYVAADSAFMEILHAPEASSPLQARAAIAHANAMIYKGDPAGARKLLLDFLARPDLHADPGLLGRAYWNLGVLSFRAQRNDDGFSSLRESRRWFSAAGDSERIVAAVAMEGEVFFLAGDANAGYRNAVNGLAMLRSRRSSTWRHNTLLSLSRAAGRDGLRFAAAAINREDAASSAASAASVAEANLAAARSAFGASRKGDGQRALQLATLAAGRVPDSVSRTQLLHDRDAIAAPAIAEADPQRALRVLNAAIAYYESQRQITKLVPALVARAATYVQAGDSVSAERDLGRAATLFDAAKSDITHAHLALAFTESARHVYEQLMLLDVHAGRPNAGLAALERGRTWSAARARPAPSALPDSGTAAVAYATAGDRLLTWVVAKGDTTFITSPFDAPRVRAAVERIRAASELRVPAGPALTDLALLYEALIRPVESHVTDRVTSGRLALVPDRALMDVPFAALWDSRTRQFLAQRAVTFVSPSISIALNHRAADDASDDITIVGDPLLDAAVFPQLAPLPGAASEAAAIRALYPRANLLTHASADSAAVARALGHSALVHFAGHALFNDAQPDQSLLAVAPRGLTAATIAGMSLANLRLVVLSACATVRTPDDATGGFAALSDAFVAAGARGTVGSLWSVEDAGTSTFMLALYRAYRADGDAAGALRHAQLEFIRAGQPVRAWGGFRYTGG